MTDGVFTLGEEGWASVTPIGKPRRSMTIVPVWVVVAALIGETGALDGAGGVRGGIGVSNDDGNRQDCL